MIRYETLILAHTGITEDEITHIEDFISNHLPDGKGKLSIFDKWGKYPLAYPIKGHTYGIYILARYEISAEIVTQFMHELETYFKIKCSDFVLRHVTVRLNQNAPTTYLKPESIDSARTTNVDTFLKDNKMDGLLNSVELEPLTSETAQDGNLNDSDKN